MKRIPGILLLLAVIVASNFFVSCRLGSDGPSWDVQVMAPLASGELSIENLIPDSVMQEDEDHFIRLVFEQDIYELKMTDFLNMPDTNYQFAAYLDSIKLNPLEVMQAITLGDIFTETGLALFIPDGSTTSIPALNGISSNNLQIDASEYFTTMTLAEGLLDIRIQNNLPVAITNLVFEVLNASDLTLISRDTFSIIYPGTMELKTINLAEKTIEGNLVANIVNMGTPGSGGQAVLINYADALETTFKVYNIRPYSATAIFPSQDLIDKGDVLIFGINEIALNSIIVRSGVMTIEGYNTVEDPVEFMYELPALIKGTDTFSVDGVIAAGSNGQASVLQMEHDVSGYDLNLQGPGYVESQVGADLNANGIIDADTINTVFFLSRASIDSTGNLISLSLQDSFIFRSALRDLIPEYASGFLGRDTLEATGIAELDFPDIFDPGSVDLEQTRLRLKVSNQLGLQAKVTLEQLKAHNTTHGLSEDLETAVSPELFIEKPIDPHSIQLDVIPTVSYFELNETNSNINELTALSPNQVEYQLQVFLNHNQPIPPIGAGTDFIYERSRLKAALEMEVPLSLIATHFNLEDTLQWNTSLDELEEVSNGRLYALVDNSFPFEASIELSLLDTLTGELEPMVMLANQIEAGSSDGINHDYARSVLEIPVDEQLMVKLQSPQAILARINFRTIPTNEYVKIYSTQRLNIKLTADFSYQIKP